jgi:hypothetical protein
MYQKLFLVLTFIFSGPKSYEYQQLKADHKEEQLYDENADGILYFLDWDILKKAWELTFDFFTPYDKIFFIPKLLGCIVYTALYFVIWLIVIIAALIMAIRFLDKANEFMWGKRSN